MSRVTPRLTAVPYALLCAGCHLVNPAIDGAVTMQPSGAAAKDAFVVGAWWFAGSDGIGSRSGCSALEVVRTDDQGSFRLPGHARRADLQVFVFKPGYVLRGPFYFGKEGPLVLTLDEEKGHASRYKNHRHF